MLKSKWALSFVGVTLGCMFPLVAQASVLVPLVASPYEAGYLLAPRNEIQVYYNEVAHTQPTTPKQAQSTTPTNPKTKKTASTHKAPASTVTKANKSTQASKPTKPTSYTVRGTSIDVNGNVISKSFTSTTLALAQKERDNWVVSNEELFQARQTLGVLWNDVQIQNYVRQNPSAQIGWVQRYNFAQYVPPDQTAKALPDFNVDKWQIGSTTVFVLDQHVFHSLSTLTGYVQTHYSWNAQDWQNQLRAQGLE